MVKSSSMCHPRMNAPGGVPVNPGHSFHRYPLNRMKHTFEPGGTAQKLWRNFSRAHLWIFLVLYFLFAAFTG